jgi:deoxycytidine triphosphate deaminase
MSIIPFKTERSGKAMLSEAVRIKEIFYMGEIFLGNELILEPHAMAIIQTYDVKIANNTVGLLMQKQLNIRRGLYSLNTNHADPGFNSFLTTPVVNYSNNSISIRKNDVIFEILRFEVKGEVLPYDSSKNLDSESMKNMSNQFPASFLDIHNLDKVLIDKILVNQVFQDKLNNIIINNLTRGEIEDKSYKREQVAFRNRVALIGVFISAVLLIIGFLNAFYVTSYSLIPESGHDQIDQRLDKIEQIIGDVRLKPEVTITKSVPDDKSKKSKHKQ